MKLLLGAIIAAAYLLATASSVKFNLYDILPTCKIPAQVTPTKYVVDLSFNQRDLDVYQGQVDISLDIANIEVNPLNYLHSNIRSEYFYIDDLGRTVKKIPLPIARTLEILNVRVYSISPKSWSNKGVDKIVRDPRQEMICIKLKRGLNTRKAKVRISFSGRTGKDMGGNYLKKYKNGDLIYKHIVSQFLSTDNRTLFHWFDKPAFEVPFKLTLHSPRRLTIDDIIRV